MRILHLDPQKGAEGVRKFFGSDDICLMNQCDHALMTGRQRVANSHILLESSGLSGALHCLKCCDDLLRIHPRDFGEKLVKLRHNRVCMAVPQLDESRNE